MKKEKNKNVICTDFAFMLCLLLFLNCFTKTSAFELMEKRALYRPLHFEKKKKRKMNMTYWVNRYNLFVFFFFYAYMEETNRVFMLMDQLHYDNMKKAMKKTHYDHLSRNKLNIISLIFDLKTNLIRKLIHFNRMNCFLYNFPSSNKQSSPKFGFFKSNVNVQIRKQILNLAVYIRELFSRLELLLKY